METGDKRMVSDYVSMRTFEREPGWVIVKTRWERYEVANGCTCEKGTEDIHLAAIEHVLKERYPFLKVVMGAEHPDHGYVWVVGSNRDAISELF